MAPEARQAENVRKMLLAMVNDVRVVVVKLADRLHNMRTLEYLEPERQQRIARETLDIYAPVANRLGMGLIRGELEDLSFRYLDPDAYLDLDKKLATKRKVFDKFLQDVQEAIRNKMVETGIPVEVQARVKRFYSLHQKIQKQQRNIDQVFDLLAVRVITDTVKNCYAALGVIHQMWPPVPGRFKDYIAMPRPNLYQSLHTALIHGGQSFEVQIRTQEMHRIAEQGVAAHWKYKDGTRDISSADDQRIVWMRQLIEWVQEMQEPSEFLSTLRVDLYPEELYTFTPLGRVVVLPRLATPIDFAYAVHTEVGHQCIGARVNGAIVPLRHPLSNGDVVEIMTQKGHEPSRDWLSFVQTSRARSKIRQWINLHEREQAKDVGRKLLEKEARAAGITLKKINDEDWQRVASEYGCGKIEDLHADLGYGKWSARQVLAKASGQTLAETAGRTSETRFDRQENAGHQRRRNRRPRPRRFDGLPLEMLQRDSGRRNRRLRHTWPRHRGAQQELPQRAESALRNRAPHSRPVGWRDAGNLPRSAAHFHGRSAWHARGHHRRDQRNGREHPHL